ncbi:hypothetical protein LTR37_014086 [Vermiconidia calcicola]|uniref:Uncharacterized protein n=1 Tax=Vermiconidia calcicola TaxID=1690605 RepID=A0ACC3MVQ2_9PEZI|nr:hypothetical protein LTR37_014086 [Vermiconidia calcicola]
MPQQQRRVETRAEIQARMNRLRQGYTNRLGYASVAADVDNASASPSHHSPGRSRPGSETHMVDSYFDGPPKNNTACEEPTEQDCEHIPPPAQTYFQPGPGSDKGARPARCSSAKLVIPVRIPHFKGTYVWGFNRPIQGYPGQWMFLSYGEGSAEQLAATNLGGQVEGFPDIARPTGQQVFELRERILRDSGTHGVTEGIDLVWVPHGQEEERRTGTAKHEPATAGGYDSDSNDHAKADSKRLCGDCAGSTNGNLNAEVTRAVQDALTTHTEDIKRSLAQLGLQSGESTCPCNGCATAESISETTAASVAAQLEPSFRAIRDSLLRPEASEVASTIASIHSLLSEVTADVVARKEKQTTLLDTIANSIESRHASTRSRLPGGATPAASRVGMSSRHEQAASFLPAVAKAGADSCADRPLSQGLLQEDQKREEDAGSLEDTSAPATEGVQQQGSWRPQYKASEETLDKDQAVSGEDRESIQAELGDEGGQQQGAIRNQPSVKSAEADDSEEEDYADSLVALDARTSRGPGF